MSTDISVSFQLAECIRRRAAEPLQHAERLIIKRALLDTLGVGIAGWRLRSARIAYDALELAQSPGAGRILGLTRPCASTTAALMNGLLAHAQLFDDNNDPMIAHPSAPLVATLLAVGPRVAADAELLLTAYCCGFETSVGLGAMLNPLHYERGWHATATLGVFGATAAASVLLGSTHAQIANALGIAASSAAGLRENFGTMVMGLHAGHAAHDGVTAALLARNDFTSSSHVFEGTYGFFAAFGAVVNSTALDNFGSELLNSGIQCKLFPSGAPTLCAVEAALALVPKLKGRIEAVRCWVDPWYQKTLKEEDPTDTFSAKVNLRYCVAAALVKGRLTLDEFETDALADQAIRCMMRRISVIIDPQLESIGTFPARLEVDCEGSTLSESRLAPRGTAASPLSDADLIEKFTDCLNRYATRDRAQSIASKILDLESLLPPQLYDVLSGEPNNV